MRNGSLTFIARTILAGLLVCAWALAFSLAWPAPAWADGRWRDLVVPEEADARNGLLANNVRALAYDVDESGIPRLWIGSDEGLQTFDGQNWGDQREPARGVTNVPVNALLGDGKTLWIGTSEGLNWRSAQGSWQSEPLDGLPVLALAHDGEATVYVGTAGGGVWSCQDGDCQSFFDPSSVVGSNDIQALLHVDDELWIGTPAGLLRYAPQQQEAPYRQFESGQSARITALQADSQGRLWVGTTAGIACYDRREEAWLAVALPSETEVHSISIDGRGRVWAGTEMGLFKWDDPVQTQATLTQTWREIPVGIRKATGTPVRTVFAAPDGMLWAGTTSGLSGLDGSWETFVRSDEGASLTQVSSLLLDRERQALWAGTEQGVSHHNLATGRWDRTWTTEDGLPSNRVLTLLLDDAANALWAGTDAGVARYSLVKGYWERVWTTAEGMAGDRVSVLVQDPATGELWAGGAGGLSHYDPQGQRWDHKWTAADGLIGDVYALVRDERTGQMWAGTAAGLYRKLGQTGRWLPVRPSGNDLTQGRVAALALDVQQDALWVAVGDQVQRYSWAKDQWERVWPVEQGTGTGQVSALVWGPEANQVWMGTEGRTSRYRQESGLWDRPWTTADGLTNGMVLAIVQGPQEGELWVGTENGISHLARRGPAPWVRLRKALAEGQDRLQEGQVALYGSRSVEYLFEGGSFAVEQGELSYGYRLYEPKSEPRPALSWLPAGHGFLIPYDELRFGNYVFELQARDRHGRESSSQTYPLRVSLWPFDLGARTNPGLRLWGGTLIGLLIVVGAGYVLRGYPAYAVRWGEAKGHPVQQLIPLVAPFNAAFDISRLQTVLQKRQAYTTSEQVQTALDELVRARILTHAEEGNYRFPQPLVAWLHRLQNLRRVGSLAESVRSQHPLYAAARTFFTQAGFEIRELSPEAFLLVPNKENHPQASYRSIYTRLIAGRALEGDDFESVANAARALYGGKITHRLAFVVNNRRPTPGARLRLYEIRQGSGLAIVSLDSELFGQVKPNMPAGDILSAQIDQATGRQNLYAISGPVSDDLSFFGRETVLQQLIDLTDAGQPVGIFGMRKTGKTSLIRRLQGRLATRRVIASLDTQGTAREQGLLPMYPAIVGAFVAHIKQYRPGLASTLPALHLWPPPRAKSLSPQIVRVFADDLRTLHEFIGGDERLLLILDEVDRLLPAGQDPGYEGFSTFLGQLRAANQGMRVLDFIVIGVDPAVNRRDKWEERDNELYKALHEVWMPAMQPEAAREMIESMGFQMGIQYKPTALTQLVHAGGGHPFLTRQICSVLVRDLLDRGTVTITSPQAQQGIEDYVYLPDSYLTELWRVRLDRAQRALLLRLAQADGPVPRADLLPSEQRQAALATLGALTEQTVIRRGRGGYVIGWGILRDWIRWIELGEE